VLKFRHLKGSVSAEIVSAGAEIGKSLREDIERAETLVGLIESCLNHLNQPGLYQTIQYMKSRFPPNLMLIITNALQYDSSKLYPTICDVFATGSKSNQKAIPY
jgi:hypothetical protein